MCNRGVTAYGMNVANIIYKMSLVSFLGGVRKMYTVKIWDAFVAQVMAGGWVPLTKRNKKQPIIELEKDSGSGQDDP